MSIMLNASTVPNLASIPHTAFGRVHLFFRRVPVPMLLSILVLISFAATALSADWISPQDPFQQHLSKRLLPPAWEQAGSPDFLLGTDQLGRDLLSRIIYGSQISLLIGLTAVAVGGITGTILGILASFWGGLLQDVIMFAADVQLAFPYVLLAISIIAILGPDIQNLILVVGLGSWVTYARIARGQGLTLLNKEFVTASRVIGCSNFRIMTRHIFPNVVSPLIVLTTVEIGRAILMEAALSFLGLGIQPPTPSWGGILNDGQDYVVIAWWIAAFPGIALAVVVLAVNIVGDGLRDILDPTLRR